MNMTNDVANSSVELVAPLACQTAENPIWHPERKVIFFTDIPTGTIYEYNPATSECRVFCRTRITGGITIQDDGSLLLFQDGPIARLDMNGTVRGLASNQCPGNDRFNDVIADPEGRVFAGGMGGNGHLYRFDPDGTVTEITDGLSIPNGMGFTPDMRGMYFTDSTPREIYFFDYDRATGKLSNRRVFAIVDIEKGLPDGMTVDSEGFVWSAIWFGGRLQRYAPNGSLEREVKLPVKQISAAIFGGPDLRDIYVTSACSTGADSICPPNHDFTAPRGGGLYRVRVPGMSGKPAFRSRLRF
jgi:D-xylono/L-arabinono-1,4-lactonase